MPHENPHPDDPHSLVGVEVPVSRETHLDMAYVIAEEFVRLGFSEQRLMSLFRSPAYRSAHQAFKIVGEEKIKLIVQEALEVWGRFVCVDQTEQEPLVQLKKFRQREEKGETHE